MAVLTRLAIFFPMQGIGQATSAHVMICSNCKKRIRLSHRPGVFLAIAGSTALAAALAWALLLEPSKVIVSVAFGMMALVSLHGVDTAMIDANAWVYSRFRREGVECKACQHINPIRPWSL